MKYYGQTEDGIYMSCIFNNPDKVNSKKLYIKETDSNETLDIRVSEWIPYKGIFKCHEGVVYKDKFVSDEVYADYSVIEDEGIPAVLYKEYINGIESSIFICKEDTMDRIAINGIILLTNNE